MIKKLAVIELTSGISHL